MTNKKKAFRPTLIPTLMTIPALILLLGLGSWQLYRLQWKNELIAKIEASLAAPIVELPEEITDIPSLLYRRVYVKGRFMHEREMYLYAGAREFKGEAGYRIFTPLQRQDGLVVLVDRGWVPVDKRPPRMRPETFLEGEQAVIGIVLPGEKKKNFTPNNQVENDLWFWVDLGAMQKYTQLKFPEFFIMQAENPENPKALPIGQNFKMEIRNDHLQYAIIWYAAAISLLVIYILYHRRLAK